MCGFWFSSFSIHFFICMSLERHSVECIADLTNKHKYTGREWEWRINDTLNAILLTHFVGWCLFCWDFYFYLLRNKKNSNVFWFEKQKRRMWHRLNDNKSLICYQILKEHFKEISNERGWKEIFSKLVFDFCCTKRDLDHATEANYGQRCVFQHHIVKWEFQRFFFYYSILRDIMNWQEPIEKKWSEMKCLLLLLPFILLLITWILRFCFSTIAQLDAHQNDHDTIWIAIEFYGKFIWFIWEEKKNNTRQEPNWKDKNILFILPIELTKQNHRYLKICNDCFRTQYANQVRLTITIPSTTQRILIHTLLWCCWPKHGEINGDRKKKIRKMLKRRDEPHLIQTESVFKYTQPNPSPITSLDPMQYLN